MCSPSLHCILFIVLIACCAPPQRCSTPKIETRRQLYTPKEKITMHTNSPIYNPLRCRVGPLNNIKREDSHYTTNNVQTSVAYNNPKWHCAPMSLATCCDSQRSIGHIHNSTPSHKGAAILRRTNTSKRIPIESQNHQPVVPAPTMGFTLIKQLLMQFNLTGSKHGFSAPNAISSRA